MRAVIVSALIVALGMFAGDLVVKPPPAVLAASFTDISGSTFADDIEWALAEGITSGCTSSQYCPGNPVSRGQMAAFVARMFDLPATTNNYFSDDDGSTFEISINRVTRAGIASGCTATRYCPERNVTRAEMTTFLSRALALTAGGANNYFYDDNGTTHEISTNRAAYAGIATGCGEWRFCPTSSVTRGQMAAFLHRVVAPVPAPLYPAPPPPTPTPTPAPTPIPQPACSPSYPDFCIPFPPPDLNCPDFSATNFTVVYNVADPDPHDLDGNKNGVACES